LRDENSEADSLAGYGFGAGDGFRISSDGCLISGGGGDTVATRHKNKKAALGAAF